MKKPPNLFVILLLIVVVIVMYKITIEAGPFTMGFLVFLLFYTHSLHKSTKKPDKK